MGLFLHYLLWDAFAGGFDVLDFLRLFRGELLT